MSRINKVGVELEGGWLEPTFPDSDAVIGSDGSVNRPTGMNHWGELRSPALPPTEIIPWVDKHYPNGANSSCGMHIHLSTKSVLDYSRLMSKEFFDIFSKKVEAWGMEKEISQNDPFWSRISGRNSFCKKEFYPERQLRDSGDRYTQLNYCWGRHGTVENRTFPMFPDKTLGLSAIQFYIDLVEEWLKSQPKERPKALSISFRKGRKFPGKAA